MSWALLAAVVSALGCAVLVMAFRRRELHTLSRHLDERARAQEAGSHAARLQYPHVDLTRCGGCGLCIEACPEEGVLELIHGQAVVVHGARCVGHGSCARECPVDAIHVTLADLDDRRDIPAVDASFEARGMPGIFLAGEITGFALIKTAIEHGRAVAGEVARRARTNGGPGLRPREGALDLCVVGAGPAGLSCALEAAAHGLRTVTIDRESVGGTVAKYPRRKLVMTQPVELPGYGRLTRSTYTKEELMAVWEEAVATQALPIRTGIEFLGADRCPDGAYRVRTSAGDIYAANVCIAVGRQGTPRKLDVPGEELPKVVYALVDARGYTDRDVLVVGGGDSAVEAALALSHRGGNRVSLSYRRHAFFRIKPANETRLVEAVATGRLQVVLESEVVRIEPKSVELSLGGEGEARPYVLPNDDVLVLAGGVPPFPLLEASGVSFDPADRPPAQSPAARGTGLGRGLVAAFALSLAAAAWVYRNLDYYSLAASARPESPLHGLLRPAGEAGLWFGTAAVGLMLANLLYLVRRDPRIRFTRGTLRAWMTCHVVTGVLAMLLAVLHGGMQPGRGVGGHALTGLAVLLATGAIGRYFYSWVPRAANGCELEIEDARRDLARLSTEWEGVHAAFGARALAIVGEIVPQDRWKGSFAARVWSLVRARARMRTAVHRLRAEGHQHGVPDDELDTFERLANRALHTMLAASHYEDLRAILVTWRWVHRWTALLVVLLVVTHVVSSLRYGSLLD